MKHNLTLAAAVAAILLAAPSQAANIVLNNVDAPGVGFNDPNPATPVGGNAGTTIGQQRLIAYRKALDLWGKTLASRVTVVVQGSFGFPLGCNATGGTLAAAGAIQIFADFPNAPLAGHWYGAALANSIAGVDLAPGPLDPGPLAPPFADDIVAFFNGSVGSPGCIEGPGWYYGLDNNPAPGQIDFLDTFMHEVAHGLGFQNFASESTGEPESGIPDVYMANTLDLDQQRPWNELTPAEIRASAINSGRVVWAGGRVSENAGLLLGPYEGVRLSKDGVQQEIEYGPAAFGASVSADTIDGEIVLGATELPGGGTVTDGCQAITADVTGKIALIDRGVCGFVVKAKNAQDAGARGVILANTLGRAAFAPGGSDPTITIATIGISNADGDAIKAGLPGVSVEYFIDPTRLAGVSEGYVRLYAPRAVEPGSSISHFDVTAAPNLLMEPFITESLRSTVSVDLTPSLMQDIGWRLETLRIGRCDSGVPGVLPTGEMLHARVEACAAGARNRGQFVSCVNGVTNAAKSAGLLTGQQHAAITSCAARGR